MPNPATLPEIIEIVESTSETMDTKDAIDFLDDLIADLQKLQDDLKEILEAEIEEEDT